MKRQNKIIALFLTFMLGIMPQYIAATLKVYRLSGEILLKKGTKEIKVQRRESLKPSDILSIPAGGRVEILDSETRRIYTSTSTGKIPVKSLIAKAAEDAKAVTRQTNRMVLEAIQGNADTRKKGYQIAGLSVHETDDILHAPVNLPEGVSYLAYLMGIEDSSVYDDSYDIILMRRDYSDNDDTFNFAVFNTLDRPLYVNIIDQQSSASPELYFKENPVAAPGKETVIREYRYLLPVDLAGYIVIASDKNFTQEDIKKLLDSKYNPEEDFYFSLLRL